MVNKLLLDEPPLVILPSLACAVGLNEAIVLQQVHYWVQHNEKEHKNYKNGYFWVYNSFNKWQEQFPWMSERTLKTVFRHLETKGILITGVFNRAKMDRTKWYRIDYNVLENTIMQKLHYPSCNFCTMDNASVAPPIPETTQKQITQRETKDVKAQSGLSDTHTKKERESPSFSETVREYGRDRVDNIVSFVDWYVDIAYPSKMGKVHPKESKAKRAIFAKKILDCARDTALDDEDIVNAIKLIISERVNCDPTIYYATSPRVLGYWLLKEGVFYDSLNGTEYAPVDNPY